MKKVIVLMLALAMALALSACGCKHVWSEANCAAPKTCSACGLTEGEALAHTWAEATCSAPKTCSVCALTEGEALPHTWTEANYQVARTCSVCSTIEGEPLAADFETKGFSFNVDQVNVAYPINIDGIEYLYTINRYEVFESDDSHPAREGFEWRIVSYNVECHGHTLPGMVPVYGDFNNYYNIEFFNDSAAQVPSDHIYAMTFAVNYFGTDYTDCLLQVERSHINIDDAGWQMEEILAFQVPAGFDGMFLCMGNANLLGDDYLENYQKMYADENTLFFRLN